MTDTTLNQGEPLHWVKRLVVVVFGLGLLATLGVVFTHVIAARVPEQRATLEKLIAERTGLSVRFDNVRFAWNICFVRHVPVVKAGASCARPKRCATRYSVKLCARAGSSRARSC